MNVYGDTETYPFGAGNKLPRIVCAQFAVGFDEPRIFKRNQAFDAISWVLTQRLVGHCISYDLGVFCAEWPELAPLVFSALREDRVHCTMVRDQLYEISCGRHQANSVTKGGRGYSLAACALDKLGRYVEKEETWRLRYAELDDVPLEAWPEDAERYAKDDIIVPRDLFQWYQANVEPHVFDDEFRQVRADFWLTLSSAWGAITDPKKVEALETFIRAEIRQHEETLKWSGLLVPSLDSEKKRFVAMGRPLDFIAKPSIRKGKPFYWARASKLAMQFAEDVSPDWPRTDKSETYENGQPSLAEEHCEAAPKLCTADCGPIHLPKDDAWMRRRCIHKILESYGKFSSLATVLSKDIPLLRQGIVQPSYGLADTGRTTAFDPNTQNFKVLQYGPKEGPKFGIRECFTPRPGHVYISADFGGLELCTLAQTCVDLFHRSRLAEVLNAGLDVHLEFARIKLGIPYEEAEQRNEAGDQEVYLARQTGKVNAFGRPGGLGDAAMVDFAWSNYRVRMTAEEAKIGKRLWFQSYPEMREFFDFVSRACEKGPATLKLWRSGLVRGGLRYTQFANTLFQGPGAYIAKAAGWELTERCYVKEWRSPLYGSRMCFFIHDEFVLETPEELAHEAAEELSRVMVTTAKIYLPDVKIKAKPIVHRIWSKKAKQLRDANGRLVPWAA